MELFAELGGTVTSFHAAEQDIDCLCGKRLLKIDKYSGDVICQKTLFEKEGLSRKLIADDTHLFIYDFCTLCVLRRKDYELIGKWRLGNDLSSDICGIAVDQDTVFCSIRNGRMMTLDRRTHLVKEFSVSDSSMWCVRPYGRHLICGCVDGKVLLLDKSTLARENSLTLGKKNVGSLLIDGDSLYAACHDGKLFQIDLGRLEVHASAHKAHRKMFACAGVYRDMLVSVSHPCSEIAFWKKDSLEKICVRNIPLKLSGHAYIENHFLYISSRNIPGIGRIQLEQLLFPALADG